MKSAHKQQDTSYPLLLKVPCQDQLSTPPSISIQSSPSSGVFTTFADAGVPPFKASEAKAPALDLANVACLVTGLQAKYAIQALERGALWCMYRYNGPDKRKYSRGADLLGGGASAVYTRVVGKKHVKWKAGGSGVGSDPVTKVQIVLRPELLVRDDRYGAWRASSTDRMGSLPGVTAHVKKNTKNQTLEEKLRGYWSLQSEKDRNVVFNSCLGDSMQENNEQTHYDELPLSGVVQAVVCTSQQTFDMFLNLEKVKEHNERHVEVLIAGEPIHVLLADKDESLLGILSLEGLY